MKAGSIFDRKRWGKPSIDEETVDAVRVALHPTPRKSIRVVSNELAFFEAQFIKFNTNDFGSMLTNYKLFKLLKPNDSPCRAGLAKEIF